MSSNSSRGGGEEREVGRPGRGLVRREGEKKTAGRSWPAWRRREVRERRGGGRRPWERKGKGRGEEKEREEKEGRGERKKGERWKGISAKLEKGKRVAAKRQGVGTEKARGNHRVWRLGGLWAVLGYSLAILKTFSFAKQFWQLILENGDDCLDKIFFRQF